MQQLEHHRFDVDGISVAPKLLAREIDPEIAAGGLDRMIENGVFKKNDGKQQKREQQLDEKEKTIDLQRRRRYTYQNNHMATTATITTTLPVLFVYKKCFLFFVFDIWKREEEKRRNGSILKKIPIIVSKQKGRL